MAFAGVSISPVGGEQYTVSISFVSASDGSTLWTKTSGQQLPISALGQTILDIIAAQADASQVKNYIVTVPSTFPADKTFEVYDTLKSLNLLSSDEVDPVPITHAEAYASTIKDDSVLFIESVPSSAIAISVLDNKKSVIHRKTLADESILKTVLSEPTFKDTPPAQVVVHGFPSDKIASTLAEIYSPTTTTNITSESVAQSAAHSLYLKSLTPSAGRRMAQYAMPLPVSIASATGTSIPLVPTGYRIPCEESITLTTSKDDQQTVTIRLLLGNNPLAKDNIQRGVVIYGDLPKAKKGEIKIRVAIEVSHFDGWREAAKITVTHDSQSKTYLFTRFLSDLPEDAEEKYEVIGNKREEGFVPESEDITGELPE